MKPFNPALANELPTALPKARICPVEVIKAVNRTECGEPCLRVGEIAALGDDDQVADLSRDRLSLKRWFEIGSDHWDGAFG
jgi:hypothetical protein